MIHRSDMDFFLSKDKFSQLVNLFTKQGYSIIAPTISDGAIVYGEIDGIEQLPEGWQDNQSPGNYRLAKREDAALFGYAVGPHAWKKYTFPSNQLLWCAERENGQYKIRMTQPEPQKYVFLGARSCELHAMKILNQARTNHRQGKEQSYNHTWIIAVNCTHPASTCFCTSMKTGPKVQEYGGIDLILTELPNDDSTGFFTKALSQRAVQLMGQLGVPESENEHRRQADQMQNEAIARVNANKGMKHYDARQFLYERLEHPHWEEVGQRCLSCANCTSVCPTCFCSTMEDKISLNGAASERWQHWDSCFNSDHSYIHGGEIHRTTASRYRQWYTHKLAYWIDQFGVSGCVGCGRCIAWCPVGIDIREEMEKLSE